MPDENYEGKLILRYTFPDGRVSALVTVGPDWQVTVFPSREAAAIFARENKLKLEEMKGDPD